MAASRTRSWILVVGAAPAAVLCLVVVGGYSLHWRWTGLSDSVTLWDWLQVLALPIALAAAPILMGHRRRLHRHHRRGLGAGAVLFLGLVLAGYLVPMDWTGFTGNTLWNWLELMLLPAVVATASVWVTAWPPTRRPLLVAGLAAVALGVLAVLGYTVPWNWTGFSGNTAWDWIKLLLLPIIVPLAILPPVTRYLTDRLAPPRDGGQRHRSGGRAEGLRERMSRPGHRTADRRPGDAPGSASSSESPPRGR